jgi:hypothetical protein
MQGMRGFRLRARLARERLASPDAHFACVQIIQQGGVMVVAVGTRIAAQTGSLWITQEGDRKDHILGAGEALVVARPGRTVVQAMRASRVAIQEDPELANDELY